MHSTYLHEEAARRLRQGRPWASREEILSTEGPLKAGEPVALRDPSGELVGLGDVDLASPLAVRRLGFADESPDGLVQRHLRRALDRRAQWVDDPRFCRLVNEDGDGLPGLVIDRYDAHYVLQTFTRAMDARVDEIARSLREVVHATSITVRNDAPRRERLKLPAQRPHVIHGTPPRWSRLVEMGARFTFDLQMGLGTGYFYDLREVRRLVTHAAAGARVLDLCCYVGGLFVHAGKGGARSIVACERDPAAADLARENAEVNGLLGRVKVVQSDVFSFVDGLTSRFDLVLVDSPSFPPKEGEDGFVSLVRKAIRATARGGRLIATGNRGWLSAEQLEQKVSLAAALERRFAFKLATRAVPPDFPTVLDGTDVDPLHAIAIELS